MAEKDKPISPEHLKFLLLNEAKQLGTLLNEDPNKSTVTIYGNYNLNPLELPRRPFELRRNTVWNRLRAECGLTSEQAYEAVGIAQKPENSQIAFRNNSSSNLKAA